MIVQCDACNTKFRLDDSKVKDKGVKVRCTKCQNVFTVMPPSPSPVEAPPSQEETFETSFGTKPESAPKTAPPDFGSFTEEPTPPKKEEEKIKPSQWSMEGMGFSFEEKPKEETKIEFDIGASPTKEEPSFSVEEKKEAPHPGVSEFDFKIGGDAAPSFKAEKKETSSFQEIPGFSFDKDFTAAPAAEKASFEIEPPPTEEEFVISPPAKQEAKTVIMQPPGISTTSSRASEEDLFGKGSGESKGVSFEVSENKSIMRRIIIFVVIILLLAGGAGLFYLKGGAGLLENIIGGKTAPQKNLDIIDLKGHYVDNASIGRLFVLEGKVISNLSIPKEVKGIRGILFDKSGKQVKDAWVAPGRILSQDELKAISAVELEKRFKDRKGTIPSKGVVPFMIVFHGISNELAEFSVEVSQ